MVEWTLDVELPPTPQSQSYRCLYSFDAAGNDMSWRLHPNGLCLIGLAPAHAVHGGSGDPTAPPLGSDKAPDGGAEQPDAAAQQPKPPNGSCAASGQQGASPPPPKQAQGADTARLVLAQKLLHAEFRKGRGPLLQPETILARLTVGRREYVLRCGVRGLLVDLNARLQDLRGAELLRALEDGYVAIVELRAAEVQQLAVACLSEEQYRQQRHLERRQHGA